MPLWLIIITAGDNKPVPAIYFSLAWRILPLAIFRTTLIVLKGSLVRYLFTVGYNIAAKSKLHTDGELRIGIVMASRRKTIQIVAQHKIIIISQIDFKSWLVILVEYLEFISQPERDKRFITPVDSRRIFARIFYGITIDMIYPVDDIPESAGDVQVFQGIHKRTLRVIYNLTHLQLSAQDKGGIVVVKLPACRSRERVASGQPAHLCFKYEIGKGTGIVSEVELYGIGGGFGLSVALNLVEPRRGAYFVVRKTISNLCLYNGYADAKDNHGRNRCLK